MSFFETLVELESNEDIHLGRLLLLLKEFSGADGSNEVAGLTKLAKLDFLLRYPAYLERALKAVEKNTLLAAVQDHERRSVESKMVRFKYGPWDFRYRKFINILIGKGLVYARLEGRSYQLGVTQKGIQVALELEQGHEFADIRSRARIIRRNFNFSGTHLKDFIYKTFPEIGTLQYGTEIK